MTWELLLLLVALVLFVLAAFGIPRKVAVQLGWLGLAAWVLIPIVHAMQAH